MRIPHQFSLVAVGFACLASLSFADEKKKPDAPRQESAQERKQEETKAEKAIKRDQKNADERKSGEKKADKGHPERADKSRQDRQANKPAAESAKTRADNIFDRLDANHDGVISKEEFGAAAHRIQERVQQARTARPGQSRTAHSRAGAFRPGSSPRMRRGEWSRQNSFRRGGPGQQRFGQRRNFTHQHRSGQAHRFGHQQSFARRGMQQGRFATRGQFGRHHQHGFQGRHGVRQGRPSGHWGRDFGRSRFSATRRFHRAGPGHLGHQGFRRGGMGFHGQSRSGERGRFNQQRGRFGGHNAFKQRVDREGGRSHFGQQFGQQRFNNPRSGQSFNRSRGPQAKGFGHPGTSGHSEMNLPGGHRGHQPPQHADRPDPRGDRPSSRSDDAGERRGPPSGDRPRFRPEGHRPENNRPRSEGAIERLRMLRERIAPRPEHRPDMKREQDRQNSGEQKKEADRQRPQEQNDKTATKPAISLEKSAKVGQTAPPVVPVPESLVTLTSK